MYHEATLYNKAYYDTIEEIPNVAKVYSPEWEGYKELTAEEMYALSDDGWYTIMHEVNWGSCDHWTSQPLRNWVNKRFNSIVRYTKGKGGPVVGYDRQGWSVTLTRDSKYWKSEVWNS